VKLCANGITAWTPTSTLHTGLAMLSMAVLVPAIVGYNGLVGAFLCLGPLRFLGKISYGCYIYHLVIREVVDKAAVALERDEYLLEIFVTKVLLTVLVASLSWVVLESRVNSLKTYFPMSKKQMATVL
jgi:peptidoglycan/LPS O-acetylase OafA/YrhL